MAERAMPAEVEPIDSFHDPRAVQILSTEYWAQLSARSLAYNEAFTRGGMFLSFLSMSFVALALVAQAMSFHRSFIGVAVIVLGFDVIVGLTTYVRILGANADDLRAVRGMARIRNAYAQGAPLLKPYFMTGIHDDLPGAMLTYGTPPTRYPDALVYGLSTSAGMVGLIVSLVTGTLAGVVALFFGASGLLAISVGAVCVLVTLVLLIVATARSYSRGERAMDVMFPSPASSALTGEQPMPAPPA